MKNKNLKSLVVFIALTIASSATLLGGYLSKCISDPGKDTVGYMICMIEVSTCNKCVDGWWFCSGGGFPDYERTCIKTQMLGSPRGKT